MKDMKIRKSGPGRSDGGADVCGNHGGSDSFPPCRGL